MIARELDLIAKAVLRHRSLYLALVCELAFGFVVTCTLLQTSRWYLRLTFADTGYPLGDLLSITVEQPVSQGPTLAGQPGDWRQQLLASLRGVSGVAIAAATESSVNELPRRAPAEVRSLEVGNLDGDGATLGKAAGAYPVVLGPGAADVYGFHFLKGQPWTFPVDEERQEPWEVVITRSLGERLFEKSDPIGKLLQIPGEPRTRVVGVVEDAILVNPFLTYAKQSMFFLGNPGTERRVQLVARLAGRPAEDVREDVRRTLQAGHPERFVSVESLRRGEMRADRVLRSIAHFLFLFVLLIGMAGLVSTAALEAFLVGQRTHQIGIKRALGASRNVVLFGVLLETLLVTLIGCAVGLGLTVLFFRAFGAIFGGLQLAWENAVMSVVLLVVNGVVAAYFPARRAASIPPSVASQGVR